MLAPTLLAAWMTAVSLGGGADPTWKRSIGLADVAGRIDHMAYDPKAKRLYVAALEAGSVEVLDVEKGERVKRLTGLKEPQGVVFVPGTNQVVAACGGDGRVIAFDAATLEEKGRERIGEDADNIRLDADGKTLVVGYGSGAIGTLDAGTLKRTGEVKLSDHPESFQLEPGGGRAFVNVPGGLIGGGGAVAVVDRRKGEVTATWKLGSAGRNFPMALDGARKRLYIGCRRPARLVVLDTDEGKLVASVECVGDVDDVFVEEGGARVLVAGGDGTLQVFETKDWKAYARVGEVKTAPGARTALYVPERRSVFVAVPERSGKPAEIREYVLAVPVGEKEPGAPTEEPKPEAPAR